MKKWLKLASLWTALVGGLAIWYSITGNSNPTPVNQRYKLPSKINTYEIYEPSRKQRKEWENVNNEKKKKIVLEKVVDTDSMDFNENFDIQNDKYRIIKKEDPTIARAIGKSIRLSRSLYFWDLDVGKGLDADRTKVVLSMLENDPNLKGLTVRINNSRGFYDLYRLFSDEKIKERNGFLPRLFIGVPISLGSEIYAKFLRGDYYNPMTQTVVLYSNIESIAAHELGHHKDFQRFKRDWLYQLARYVPPVILYQEWKANKNTKEIMAPEDKWQFYRYLLPAFLTYIMGTWRTGKKLYKKITGKDERDD